MVSEWGTVLKANGLETKKPTGLVGRSVESNCVFEKLTLFSTSVVLPTQWPHHHDGHGHHHAHHHVVLAEGGVRHEVKIL
jgi:hypothetical protein